MVTVGTTETSGQEFRLSPPIGAAIQAMTGLQVPGAAGLVDPETPALDQLGDAGLLDEGALRPDLATALERYAARTRAISVAIAVPERQSWERLIAYGTPDREAGYVAVSTVTGSTVVSTFPATEHLADVARPHLFLTQLPKADTPFYDLSLESWATLLAIADVLHRRELQSVLARQTLPVTSLFASEELAESVAAGRNEPDLRWMCSLGAALSPLPLPATNGELESGLRQLHHAGLLAAFDSQWQLTPAGEVVAFIFRSLVSVGVFGGTRIRPGAPNEWAMAVILSTPVGAWLLRWGIVTESSARATFGPASRDDLLAVIRELEDFSLQLHAEGPALESPALEPSAATRPCSTCGTPLAPVAKFCSTCGTVVAAQVFCSSCGRKLSPTARFCGGCGKAVKAR